MPTFAGVNPLQFRLIGTQLNLNPAVFNSFVSSGSLSVTGSLSVSGSLVVLGTTQLQNTQTQNLFVSGTLTVSQSTYLSQSLTAANGVSMPTGNMILSGNLASLSGAVFHGGIDAGTLNVESRGPIYGGVSVSNRAGLIVEGQPNISGGTKLYPGLWSENSQSITLGTTASTDNTALSQLNIRSAGNTSFLMGPSGTNVFSNNQYMSQFTAGYGYSATTAITGNYVVGNLDAIIPVSASTNITITLQTTTGSVWTAGRAVTILDVAGLAGQAGITIQGVSGSETINGQPFYTISQNYTGVELVSLGNGQWQTIKVVQPPKNVIWPPLSTPGGYTTKAFWDASLGTNSHSKGMWADLVNGYAVTQATSGQQPTLVSNVQNGFSGFQFVSSSQSSMGSTSISLYIPQRYGPETIVVAGKFAPTGSASELITTANNGRQLYFSNALIGMYDGAILTTGSVPDGNFCIYVAIFNNENTQLYKDGNLIMTGSSGTGTGGYGMFIGSDTTGTSLNANMTLCALQVFQGAMSIAQVKDITRTYGARFNHNVS